LLQKRGRGSEIERDKSPCSSLNIGEVTEETREPAAILADIKETESA
jgi:hypothetical protein